MNDLMGSLSVSCAPTDLNVRCQVGQTIPGEEENEQDDEPGKGSRSNKFFANRIQPCPVTGYKSFQANNPFDEECFVAKFSQSDGTLLYCSGPYWQREHEIVDNFTIDFRFFVSHRAGLFATTHIQRCWFTIVLARGHRWTTKKGWRQSS